MHRKAYLAPIAAALFVCAACSAFAQTAPAAKGSGGFSSFAAGAGFSGFNPDWDHGHLLGGTLWIDYTPAGLPSFLRGFGLEAEARDLNYGRSQSQPWNLREDVAGGGVIYSYHRLHSFHPYGKFLVGYGNTDYGSNITHARGHDSRTVTSTGGGVELRVYRNLWARADYEYQFWPDFFKGTSPAGQLNPQGFTVGALYHFRSRSFH